MKSFKCLLLLLILNSYFLAAQPTERLIKVLVSPENENWNYSIGQTAKFNVMVIKNGAPLKNTKIIINHGPEKFSNKKDSTTLNEGTGLFSAGTMKVPGFYRFEASTTIDGIKYRGFATAGFEPEKIQPAAVMPANFDKFWNDAKADLAKIPIDARMTLMPERCTEKVNVYHVNLANFKPGGSSRLYGILCVPKKEGKYPAILHVPGAGARPYNGDIKSAEKGIITFQIGIHGVPVNMPTEVYNDMLAGTLFQYWTYNLDNPDLYYFKRVYLGCLRANDFIFSLPQFDGSNLAVTGGSQGGALTIVTAALDARVKFAAPTYPALADQVGYLQGRAGGWPHMFDANNKYHHTPEKINTANLYDVVNFAKQLKVPVYYSMGYNDETCPPTSMWSAYNVIRSPKTLSLFLETGHWTFPEESEATMNWLYTKLGVK